VIGFGFGAVWMTAGLGSAILSLMCAAVGFGVAGVLDHRRPSAARRERSRRTRHIDVETMPLAAESGW
jgi:hypothetical protein